MLFRRFAKWATHWSGTAVAFVWSMVVVLLWALVGPIFGWSDTHQLIINTVTSLITFWMVFLIQHSQNVDSAATQAKLDELIRATRDAGNHFISVEEMSEDEILLLREQLRQHLAEEQEEAREPEPAG